MNLFNNDRHSTPKSKRIKKQRFGGESVNVFSFSGGRTSAYMTIRYAKAGDLVIFANTGKEHAKTLDFVHQVMKHCETMGCVCVWLEYCPENGFKQVAYETAARDGAPYRAFIEHEKYLPNAFQRTCTIALKIKPMAAYIASLGYENGDVDMYIGIRYDEPRRYYNNKENREGYNNQMPLFEAKVTKDMVLGFWQAMPFDLEIPDGLGNCTLCFLKGKTKRISILNRFPEEAKWWIEMEEITGASFDKNWTVKQLLEIAKMPQIWEDENDYDIPCNCNID